jgi:hypothetical protein
MENLLIKNFCLTIIGKNKGVGEYLTIVSEGPINYLEGNEVFIATFQSFLTTKDIESILSEGKFNFIIFEIIPSLFSANLGKLTNKLFDKKIYEPIFNPKDYEDTVVNYVIEEELDLDQLLDLISQNGYNSLTKKQKEKLNFLSTK